MMTMRGIFARTAMLATTGLGAATLSTAAFAAETFNFTGPDTPEAFVAGNVRTVTGSENTKVEVSAWYTNGLAVSPAFLGRYVPGMGVSDFDGEDHTIDNAGAYDFVILQFDHVVTVHELGITGFGDTDLNFAVGNTSTPFSGTLSIANFSTLTTLFDVIGYSDGNGGGWQTRSVNPANASGNLFLVAAASGSGGDDSFKLNAASITTPAVPEPATWAMMIGGFGLIGGTMRRRAAAAVRFA
jgi:hypothetical protein